MNGLIENGVVLRSWIVRHGPEIARAENERQPAARDDRKLGYVCMPVSCEQEYVTHSC